MAKIFMPELDPKERIQVLKNNADHIEETTYEKDLTQDELDAKREEFVDNDIKIATLEDELNEKKAEFKNKMEPIKLVNRSLRREVKTKKKEVKGQLFHMADHVNSVMETYDHEGEFVSSRRLRPDEKESRRLSFIKPAANGQ